MPVAIVTIEEREAAKMRAEVKGCCLACGGELELRDWFGVKDPHDVWMPARLYKAFLWDTQVGKAGHCIGCITRDWTNEQAHAVMAAYQASHRQEPS